MTVPDVAVTLFVTVCGGGGGALLYKLLTRKQDVARMAADTRKVAAEAAHIESASWADLLKEYREEVVALRQEVAAVRNDYDVLDDHVGTLERIMRRAGLEVPERPARKAI